MREGTFPVAINTIISVYEHIPFKLEFFSIGEDRRLRVAAGPHIWCKSPLRTDELSS